MTDSNLTPAKGQVCPFYFVVDLSGSMEPYLSTLHLAIEKTIQQIKRNDEVAEKCRLSIVVFGNFAKTLIPLCDTSLEHPTLPAFESMGGTEFLSAFRELFKRIDEDVESLKKHQHSVLRPCVYFLTDGNPTDETDEWLERRQQLLEQAWRPNIVAYGFGDVNEKTLVSLATKGKGGDSLAFIHDRSHDTSMRIGNLEDMFIELFKLLTQSIIAAGQSMVAGKPIIDFPQPTDFRQIDMDVI